MKNINSILEKQRCSGFWWREGCKIAFRKDLLQLPIEKKGILDGKNTDNVEKSLENAADDD